MARFYPLIVGFMFTSVIYTLALAAANNDGHDCSKSPFKHVIAISIDGMHSSDVEKWTVLRPESNISALLQHGYEFSNAWTSAPSDSFPGILAQLTGATPRTTGVWYDDTWDRSYYAPGSGCKGAPGAEGKRPIDNFSTL